MDNAPNSLEPVAWILTHQQHGIRELHWERRFDDAYIGWTETPLYAHPAPKPADSQLVEAVAKIAKGETEEFDSDLQRSVILSMSEGEMQEIAQEALAAISQHQPPAEPTAKDALQAIANLPTGSSEDVMNGQEQAYRAVEALFDSPPAIRCEKSPADAEREALLDAVVAEIEFYGEGLIPDLRIVTGWLADHFRNPDHRASLASGAHREASNG